MLTYENYAKFRNSQRLRDSDVAKKAGIPQSTFSDWKKGKSTPKMEKIQKIADALGTTPAHIMGWDEYDEINKKQEDVLHKLLDLGKIPHQDYSEEEQRLLQEYRNLNEESKRQLVVMLAFLKDQQDKK